MKYPGVYVQEVPSGVETITGVATSITAFVGRTRRGPVNKAITIINYGEFEHTFGGLSMESTMSYAVMDFFLNGGTRAVIVRVYHVEEKAKPEDLKAGLKVDTLNLEAKFEGEWANKLTASINYPKDPPAKAFAEKCGVAATDLFNLTVSDGQQTVEYTNLTVVDGSRRVDRVLEHDSDLVRVSGAMPADRPAELADSADPTAVTKAIEETDLVESDYLGSEGAKTGLYALEQTDLFNLLCIPPMSRETDTTINVYQAALAYCVKRRAMLIVDPPRAWKSVTDARDGVDKLNIAGEAARNAVLYFPRINKADQLEEGRPNPFVPCGAMAGVMARTDASRGVWKAPAGPDATLRGIDSLTTELTELETGQLSPLGINCLRSFPEYGTVAWGARTMRGADVLSDEYKYIPVRRLRLYIEETLFRNTKWAVFELNDEPLWASLRLNISAFMAGLFHQGALQGESASAAYFVKCDSGTTTQYDTNKGIVNVFVGFAPLKPADFVILHFQQMAGQIQT